MCVSGNDTEKLSHFIIIFILTHQAHGVPQAPNIHLNCPMTLHYAGLKRFNASKSKSIFK